MNLRLEKFSSMVKKQLAPIMLEHQIPGSSVSVNSIKIASIKDSSGEMSRILATKLKSKFSPRLSFHLDTGQNDSARIEELLSGS